MDAAKLLLILALIVLALRRKIPIGLSLTGAGLAMAVIYQIPMDTLWEGYVKLVKSAEFISLTAVVILITLMGAMLNELGHLDKLSEAVRMLPGGNRVATAMIPPMIGLMPMPGGSLMSAPLVDKLMVDGKYSPELKLITNYWFRHIAEFVWPMYAGLILTEALTGMPIYKVSMMQSLMTVAMIIIGAVMFIRKIDRDQSNESHLISAMLGIGRSIWPVGLAILVYGLFKIDLSIAVLAAVVVLILIARPSFPKIKKSLWLAFSPMLILLVFGVLSFQMVIELSGAVNFIPELATRFNLPAEVIVFSVCFTIGLLTGMVSAYVGLGYTILAPFLYQSGLEPALILLAYTGGYIGIMISPSHLCLILTSEFFKADLIRVYRTIAIPILLLMITGILLSLSGWPQLFKP